jgi:L,D-transpeptidase catalytic domain/Bacterial Ig-like domain
VVKVGGPEQEPSEDGSDGQGQPGGQGREPTTRAGGLGRNKKVIAVGTAAAAIAIAGGAYAITQHGSNNSAGTQAAQVASGPMRVNTVLPARGTGQVDGAAPITVSFSDPLGNNAPDPTISPSVPGSWSSNGTTLTFTPTTPFPPSTKVTVSVPGGPGGIRAADGSLLTQSVTDTFTTGKYSQLGLAEILSELGYLPLTWSPSDNGAAADQEMDGGAASQTAAGMAYNPPQGTFTWEPGYPSDLHGLWSANQPNVVVRGAVMAFQEQHNQLVTGNLTRQFWKALFKAATHGQNNQVGYTYALASKNLPESLTIWHDGRVVEHTLANTGIPVSPTVDGSFPVYEKFRFQIMRGTNPDGSTYADPVSFVSYFNGGDAVHYFPRGSYGFQQSLGCVELPWSAAQQAYPYLTYGSIVTVAG